MSIHDSQPIQMHGRTGKRSSVSQSDASVRACGAGELAACVNQPIEHSDTLLSCQMLALPLQIN
jgi:hypothetical protein